VNDMEDRAPRDFSGGEQEEASSPDGRTLATLRSLILAPEQREIRALRERLENPELRAKELSTVVAEAIRLRHVHGGSQALIEVLTPSVEGALRESARKDPRILSEVLFPVVGPAIRTSITHYIESLLESFNKVLEHSISSQAIRWRMEAFRTGKTFAEVVLLHNLLYRVEQVFLIHSKTSLILHHAVAPEVSVRDPALVSGMLSAIRDFGRDSFNVPKDDTVESMQLGELRVWVEEGPHAILAAAIRGHPPETLRLRFREALEKVHRDFGSALEQFDGDSSAFEAARDDLTLCLESRYQESAHATPKPYFLIVLLLALAATAAWMWVGLLHQRQWNHFVDKLRAQPGLAITSFTRERGQYQIRGLRDPLAVEPRSLIGENGLDSKRVQFQWTSYYSLDDAILLKRVAAVLRPPATVTLSVQDGTIRAKGEASAAWIQVLKTWAISIPGVQGIDTSGLQAIERAEVARQRKAIESVLLPFAVNRSEMETDQYIELQRTAKRIKAMLADAAMLGESLAIEVVGHCDRTGVETWNLRLSRRRAHGVARRLTRTGIKATSFRVRGAGSSEPVQIAGMGSSPRYDRSVTFRVVVRKSPEK
jgi:outer membrane protein OmpA-like peptidoglycan-associated protein